MFADSFFVENCKPTVYYHMSRRPANDKASSFDMLSDITGKVRIRLEKTDSTSTGALINIFPHESQELGLRSM